MSRFMALILARAGVEQRTLLAPSKEEAERRLRAELGSDPRIWVWSEDEVAWSRAPGRDSGEVREVRAMVWRTDPDRPGERVVLHARSLDEAHATLVGQFGTDAVISLWNEEDSNRKR